MSGYQFGNVKSNTVHLSIKDYFFDRLKVMNRLETAKRKMLSQAGAFVRRNAMRDQLRRRKRISAAGSPPSVHSRDQHANLRWILFGFDGVDSVIVGPVGLNGARGAVPGLHEHGGTKRIREVLVGKQWEPEGKLVTLRGNRKWFVWAVPGRPMRWRMARYPARPFMLPALKAVAPKFPKLFGNLLDG